MPEKFDYPTNGWSTGKMRKKGDKFLSGEADLTEGARAIGEQNPVIKSILDQHHERMKAQGIPEQMKAAGTGPSRAKEFMELEGLRKEKTQKLSDVMFAPKNGSITDAMKANPNGFITTEDHPDLKGLDSNFDIQPMPDMDGHVLVKPKPQMSV